MARPPVDTHEDYDPETPNHMILWLDVTIGDPNEYKHLKKAFGSNTDPRHETWTMLTDHDYTKLIAGGNAEEVKFEGVQFLLQAVTNEDDCLKAFEKNRDKHIFFITSGSLGQKIMPKVIERYRHIFTDPITNQPYTSVYVFCHNIEYHVNWAMDYSEYMNIFNMDSELLERMTCDIAEYFIERGRRIRQGGDLQGALQRLHWAKRLWNQFEKMRQEIATDNPRPVRVTQRMRDIDELIAEIEAELPKESSDDDAANSDDERHGESCS